jgi:hypothetical protein
MRIRIEQLNENTLRISVRSFPIALYLKDRNELYRIEGSLQMQWMWVLGAFRSMYHELKTY